MTYPTPRTRELIVQEAGDELLVYDTAINKSFCLNPTSARVWQECDGRSAACDIARRTGLPEEYVSVSLAKLEEAGLIEGGGFVMNRVTRRKMLMKAGAVAAAIPVITSLIAPMAAHAQSACLGFNQSFDLTQTPFFADATECVNALIIAAVTRCCSSTLNPASGFIFGSDPQLCRGFCGNAV